MSTLKDVAEIAGVSVSTVSYVLSGKKTVRPETLKRIQDAIKQVDYCPNLGQRFKNKSIKNHRGCDVGYAKQLFH